MAKMLAELGKYTQDLLLSESLRWLTCESHLYGDLCCVSDPSERIAHLTFG